MKKIALILALSCGLAHASFRDGNILYRELTSGKDSEWFYAAGYVAGVFDSQEKLVHCAPGEVELGQILALTKNYLERYPEYRHLSADSIVGAVLMTAWPCPQKKKGPAL